MDKQTLSNYGWLVIVTLILAIMLALATPFGTYVGDGVVSVANGLVGTSDQAIDEDNIGKVEDQWDSKFDYSGFEGDDTSLQLQPGATFNDGVTLTWDELQLTENGTKYGYDASKISNTEIGASAFSQNTNIISIVIPDSVTTFGDGVFSYCTALTTVVMPNDIVTIPDFTFWGCYDLKDVNIPKTVTHIGDYGISVCFDLKEITIQPNVTSLGTGVFSSSKISTINFCGTKAQWDSITKGNDWNKSCPEITIICTDGTITIPAWE